MAELIEMPFGLWTWAGPRNHALDRGPDPPWEGAILSGERRPIAKYRDYHPCAAAFLSNYVEQLSYQYHQASTPVRDN